MMILSRSPLGLFKLLYFFVLSFMLSYLLTPLLIFISNSGVISSNQHNIKLFYKRFVSAFCRDLQAAATWELLNTDFMSDRITGIWGHINICLLSVLQGIEQPFWSLLLVNL